ncbi:hypothetical protein [Natronoflexus pectinivorans]|nr:hypothetical protein [Natronoflexus pectinivorans]
MDDPVLEAHLHAGNPAYKKSKEYIDLMERTPYLLSHYLYMMLN